MPTAAIEKPIEDWRAALERDLERFRALAVSELRALREHLPRAGLALVDHRACALDAWREARQRHDMARRGLLAWRPIFVPPARSAAPVRKESVGRVVEERLFEPRAA